MKDKPSLAKIYKSNESAIVFSSAAACVRILLQRHICIFTNALQG